MTGNNGQMCTDVLMTLQLKVMRRVVLLDSASEMMVSNGAVLITGAVAYVCSLKSSCLFSFIN